MGLYVGLNLVLCFNWVAKKEIFFLFSPSFWPWPEYSVQEMFCKQKGYLEEELDYRKQALDQAYMVCVYLCAMYTSRCWAKISSAQNCWESTESNMWVHTRFIITFQVKTWFEGYG